MGGMDEQFRGEEPPTVLWEQPAFRVAYKLYVASWLSGLGVSLVAPTTQTNLLVGVPIMAAVLWAMWHWGRKPGSFSPKWFLLVLSAGGLAGSVQMTFTNNPLRLVQGALSLVALVVLVRRWPRRERATTLGTPTIPAAVQPPSVAGWRDDPTGVHDYRYWDGHTWTEHVAHDGVVSQDSITTPDDEDDDNLWIQLPDADESADDCAQWFVYRLVVALGPSDDTSTADLELLERDARALTSRESRRVNKLMSRIGPAIRVALDADRQRAQNAGSLDPSTGLPSSWTEYHRRADNALRYPVAAHLAAVIAGFDADHLGLATGPV
jgi:hypothetical protein